MAPRASRSGEENEVNASDSDRLAQIRAQNEKWLAVEPNAVNWDTTFLLRMLDGQNFKKKARFLYLAYLKRLLVSGFRSFGAGSRRTSPRV